MNILAIGAHPDDVELNCAGTLAKYAAEGHKVFIATSTNGNVGSAILPKDEIAEIRKAEAAKSAALIGAEYICLDFDDEFLYDDKAARLAFLDLARYCQPDVILTHYYDDYLTDHEWTGKIINDIVVLMPVAKIETKNPPCEKFPAVYYFEPALGLGFVPTDYVDITDFYDTKCKMLLCHESQRQWLADNYGGSPDNVLLEDIRVPSEYRGYQCGVKYAEGFVRCNNAYRVTPSRLLP